MANPIVQRLIAAGASPARANAFAAQFAKSQPSVKTQNLEDAFDEQLGALSQTYFPNVFRPPAVDDPKIDIYLEFIAPGSSKKINDRVFAKTAPTFLKAQNSPIAYEKTLANLVKAGASLAQIQKVIQTDLEANNPDLIAFPVLDVDTDQGAAAGRAAQKLFTEYNDVQPALIAERQTVLDSNKYYKAGLPDPKLKYGKTEDLSKGIISFETHPQVEKALKNIPAPILAKSPETRITSQLPSQPSSMPLYDKANPKEAFFKEFSSSKANPLKDEITRREYLKDKTTR